MKVWASATAIGFSMAYLACSSSPPSDSTYVPPAGGGATSTAGAAPTAGSNPGTSGATQAGGGADTGGGTPGGGAPSTGGAGGGAPPAGGAGGGAPPAGGAAGAGGASTGETEVPCPMINGKLVDGHCSSGVTYAAHPGFTLALVEDFPVPINLNTDPVFTWSDGIPNDSQTNFAEGQITFANGRMTLTAISKCAPAENNATCYPPPATGSYAESHSDMVPNKTRPGTGVTSGELRSKYNNYRYGRYEAKYTAPSTTIGNYLSTMFVFRNPANTAWNEIDNELEPNHQGQLNLNTVYVPMGDTKYPGYAADAKSFPVSGLNISAEHVYAFEWTPTDIKWFVDGTAAPVYTHPAATTPGVPSLSAKIMMNLWVFHDSSNFGDVTKNVYPMTSSYDYFHFYKLDNGEPTYPCSPTPACLNKANGDYTAGAQNNIKETPYLK